MPEQSFAAMAGHDVAAGKQIDALVELYRREGRAGIRAAVAEDHPAGTGLNDAVREHDGLLVEAVHLIAEYRSPRAIRGRAYRAADAEEDRAEAEREARR